jgi:hypothetical protein
MMANRGVRLVEIDYIFLTPASEPEKRNRITVHASLHNGQLYLSFSIGGPAEARETLPATLVDAIRAGLEYAADHVRIRDLVDEGLELDR